MKDRELSEEWVGRTQFELLRTVPPPNMYHSGGKIMVKRPTQRPLELPTEEWDRMRKTKRANAIASWQK